MSLSRRTSGRCEAAGFATEESLVWAIETLRYRSGDISEKISSVRDNGGSLHIHPSDARKQFVDQLLTYQVGKRGLAFHHGYLNYWKYFMDKIVQEAKLRLTLLLCFLKSSQPYQRPRKNKRG